MQRRPARLCRIIAIVLVVIGSLHGQDSRGSAESRELAAIAGSRFLGLYSHDVKIGSGTMERTVAADAIVVAINAATDLGVAPGRLIAAYSRVLEFDPKPPRQLRSAVETIETPQQITQSTRVEQRTLTVEGPSAKWQRTVSRRGSDGKSAPLEDEKRSTAVPRYTLDDELRGQVWVRGGAAAGASIQFPRLDLLQRKLVIVRLTVVRKATSRTPNLAESRMVLCTEREDAAGKEIFIAFRPDGWPCFIDLPAGLVVRAEPDGLAQSPIGWDGHMAGPVIVEPGLSSPAILEKLHLKVGGSLAAILVDAPGQSIERTAGSEDLLLRLDLKARPEDMGAADRRKLIEPTPEISSADREIVAFVKEATQGAPTTSGHDRVVALLGAVRDLVSEDSVPDGVTATQVLAHKRGGPRGRALLFVAAARALKIPARGVRGLWYEPGVQHSYLPHWWAEVEIDGAWVAVDPTMGQIPADISHLRCRPLPDASLPPGPTASLTIRPVQ